MISFNFYYDLYFWLAFAAVVIGFRFLNFNAVVRSLFLCASSILMILALPRFDLPALVFLISLSLFTFLVGWLLMSNVLIEKRAARIFVSGGAIVLLVMTLAFFKYRLLQGLFIKNIVKMEVGASDIIFIIGISYFSFKMMHFVIESYKRQIKQLSLLNFLNYVLFFPSFISGPISRYNHFCEQLTLKKENHLAEDTRRGLERVIHGLFKKFVLSTIVFSYTLVNKQGSLMQLTGYEVIVGMYAYTLYLYFDFAGYSDIALGAARIMGIELPENFNAPFLKKNIQELWASWHMSLTRWLTDYVYWPLAKLLRKNEGLSKRPVLLSNISIIVTFIICGMWHGEALNFVVWGFYHGIGLSILNIYQKQKRKIRNKVARQYFLSRYSQWAGTVATFNFFVLGILIFSLDLTTLKTLLMGLLFGRSG